ncbi:kelch-like protein 10 [Argiope bruennichi]|uniref:kelch-like protein 10 n=1 Tax=Argiope bruennichi TaxID=94029 RepID=UPI002495933E|nr:kelch-like protein 10 [Argiope bruennichi]
MTDFNQQRLVTFKELLDSEELVNLTLVTEDGGQLKVHLELLAAISPYFRRMIDSCKNSAWETIHVPGTSKDTLSEIVNYIYTGKLCLREDKVKALIDAAELLQVPGVVKLCKQFLASTITVSNCISRYNFANCYQYSDLKEKAITFILANFEDVYKTNTEYSDLHIDDLLAILNSDTLNVKEEETVYWAMLKWVDADSDNRILHLSSILRCLRIGLCNFKFFEDHIWSNELISRNEDCHGILYQASQLFADLQNGDSPQTVYDLHHPFLRPRVPNEIIFVMGGWSAGSATNIMETYDCKTQRWFLALNSDTIPRAYHGMIWHQQKIYVIGGFDGNQCFNSVRCYDPVTYVWEEKGCMYVQRCYVSVAAVGEYLYALGGYDGHRRNKSCERYDSNRNQWSFIANMHNIRSDASADSLDGKIYIAGGFNGTQVLDSAECYDPETNEWTLIPNMNTPRSGVKVVAFRNYLFVIGGFNGSNRLSTGKRRCPIERYDKVTKMWTFVAPMLGPRSNFATAIINDLLYAIGGFNGLSTIASAELYDPVSNSWQPVTDLNLNRSALAACKVSNISTAQEYTYIGMYTQVG